MTLSNRATEITIEWLTHNNYHLFLKKEIKSVDELKLFVARKLKITKDDTRFIKGANLVRWGEIFQLLKK